MSDAEKQALKPEVRAIADEVKKVMTIEGDKAVLPEDFYKSHLPDGVTIKQAETLSKHNVTMLAGVTLGLGEAAIPVLAKDKSLDRIKLVFPTVSRDRMEASIDRSRIITHRNPSTGEQIGDPETYYGIPTARHMCYGGKARGQMAIIKEMLQADAKKAFGKK